MSTFCIFCVCLVCLAVILRSFQFLMENKSINIPRNRTSQSIFKRFAIFITQSDESRHSITQKKIRSNQFEIPSMRRPLTVHFLGIKFRKYREEIFFLHVEHHHLLRFIKRASSNNHAGCVRGFALVKDTLWARQEWITRRFQVHEFYVAMLRDPNRLHFFELSISRRIKS